MLTAERVREVLDYDQDSGVFRWKLVVSKSRVKREGIAGWVRSDGYRFIGIDGKVYLAQRLAVLYVTGNWPDKEVDHKNGIPGDDRFENLRDLSHAMNLQNQRRARRGSKTGWLGVSPCRGKFQATLGVNGERHYLGSFDTPELAHAAYLEAKRKLHKGCAI